jgi:SAM-dependent methyltransferase
LFPHPDTLCGYAKAWTEHTFWGDPWQFTQALLALVVFLIPLTYALLNFLTERMADHDEKKVWWWSRDRLFRKYQLQVKMYFVFADWLTSEITLNTAALLLVTFGLPERLWWTLRCRTFHVWWLVIPFVPLLVAKALLIYAPIINRFTNWPYTDSVIARRHNIDIAFGKDSGVRGRAGVSLILLILAFFSPATIFFLGTYNPLVVVLPLVYYVLLVLALSIVWEPVSALHRLTARRMMFSDLGRQQKLSFEVNAAGYEEDDLHRSTDATIALVTLKLRDLRKAEAIRVLYAGCGPGEMLSALVSKWCASKDPRTLAIDAVESAPMMLQRAEESVRETMRQLSSEAEANRVQVSYFLTDFLKLEIPDGFYDAILCLNNTLGNLVNETLESAVVCRQRALRLFGQWLKSEGCLILTVYSGQPGAEYTKSLKYLPDGPERKQDGSQFGPNDWIMELDLGQSAKGFDQSLLYSHWFSRAELGGLLDGTGAFKVDPPREERHGDASVLTAVCLKK